MIEKLKTWLNKRPTDRPRDKFSTRFRGSLWKPTLRCTVCDSVSERQDIRGVGGLQPTQISYQCPTCSTDGLWKYDLFTDKTRLDNLYPDEWGENPYDTTHDK